MYYVDVSFKSVIKKSWAWSRDGWVIIKQSGCAASWCWQPLCL